MQELMTSSEIDLLKTHPEKWKDMCSGIQPKLE
jgi:hypothetical protein